VHGHVLAQNVTDLFDSGPLEPYMANESAAFQFLQVAWTGIDDTGITPATETCTDWTVDASGGSWLGKPYDALEFLHGGSNNCSTSGVSLVCVER
jgi:hypothetical protein